MSRTLRLLQHFLLYGSLGFAGLNLVAASGWRIFPLPLAWLLFAAGWGVTTAGFIGGLAASPDRPSGHPCRPLHPPGPATRSVMATTRSRA